MRGGARVWTCDGCGKRETWRKGWGYLHGVVSLANDGGTSLSGERLWLPLAACSEACMDVALAKAQANPCPLDAWMAAEHTAQRCGR